MRGRVLPLVPDNQKDAPIFSHFKISAVAYSTFHPRRWASSLLDRCSAASEHLAAMCAKCQSRVRGREPATQSRQPACSCVTCGEVTILSGGSPGSSYFQHRLQHHSSCQVCRICAVATLTMAVHGMYFPKSFDGEYWHFPAGANFSTSQPS